MTYPVLVVIPLYNAEAYIRQAIESIQNQTYQNWKLLIINDGSTDSSEGIARSIIDDRIMVWNQINQGPAIAMNRAIKYAIAQGYPFIARADADDLAMSRRLETQIAILLKSPRYAACSSNSYYIDPINEQIIGKSTVPCSSPLIKWEIQMGLRGMIQPAVTFRTNLLAAVGGYREKFKTAEEVDLFLRISQSSELINSPEFLCKIRLRRDSLSTRDVRRNVLYSFYALNCSERRGRGLPERSYEEFVFAISNLERFNIWREELLLYFWRKNMSDGNLLSLIASLIIDPKRFFFRIMRLLDGLQVNASNKYRKD